MCLYYVLPFILLILQTQREIKRSIYIAKIDWHVGIIIKVDQTAIQNITALQDFTSYKYVDVGWGDADFYQSGEDFDLYLASKAILFPTNSVIRIQGYDYEIKQLMNWRDYVFEIELSQEQFDLLCKFIDESFSMNNDKELIVESERYRGSIKYFSSVHKYHLFNTCNTWVAAGLEFIGLPIDEDDIITAEQLYEELQRFAKIIKTQNE